MIGDNSVDKKALKSFVERIEVLLEDRAAITADIRDVYKEAKTAELDVKTIRKVIRIRALDQDKRREDEEILDVYLSALGLL